MKKFVLILSMLGGIAIAQPKLSIPYSGFSVSTLFISPSVTNVDGSMFVRNLDSSFSFSDSLFIKIGVKDTIGQVFEMSSVNVGPQTIPTLDSIYLPTVNFDVNTSLFMDGNNTVVIWPAAPNSLTFDSVEVIFFYNSINDIIVNNLDIKLGPNPAQEFVYLGDPQNLVKQVRIRDLNGKLVGTHKTQTMFSVAHIPNGLYTVELQLDQGVVVRKLIIQNK